MSVILLRVKSLARAKSNYLKSVDKAVENYRCKLLASGEKYAAGVKPYLSVMRHTKLPKRSKGVLENYSKRGAPLARALMTRQPYISE